MGTTQNPIHISKEEHEQIQRITFYDAGVRTAFGNQMGYAYLAGMELVAVKTRLRHGRFTAWRETHVPHIPERSAQRYMRFSVALAKSATVADLPTVGNLRLINGEIPEGERNRILRAVEQVADGKTLTELYRDLGMVRDPQAHGYHPQKMTAEEKIEAEKQQAEAKLDRMLTGLRIVLDDLRAERGILVERISRGHWIEARQLTRAVGKAITPLCRASRK